MENLNCFKVEDNKFAKGKNEKYLYRKNFMNLVDSNKIWYKTMSLLEIKNSLDILENEFSKHEFEVDKNFIMNSRRKLLREDILDRLKKEEIKKFDLSQALFNFWEFVNDEYSGNFVSIADELGLPGKELYIMDQNYREKGIISEGEKEVIIEIINILKEGVIKVKDF